jgi:hypothetical protein
LVNKTLQENGRLDLLRAWRADAHISLALPLFFEDSTRIIDELAKALRTLEKLETVASRAFNDARRKNGRPERSLKLPTLDTIIGLAGVYRRSAGMLPAAGDGVFSQFAFECLKALGHTNFKYSSLVNAIKRARHQAQLYSATSHKPSPFQRD